MDGAPSPPYPPLMENVINCFFGSIPIVEFQLLAPSHLLNPTYAIQMKITKLFNGSATVPTWIIVRIEAHNS